jgi:hypothetical protein
VAAGAGIFCMAGAGVVLRGTKSTIKIPEELRALELAGVMNFGMTGAGATRRGIISGRTLVAVRVRELGT